MRATSRWHGASGIASAVASLMLLALGIHPAAADRPALGGDGRYYQFLRLNDAEGERRDAELAILRLKLESPIGDPVKLEAHGVGVLSSPGSIAGVALARTTTRRFFDLETTAADGEDLAVLLEIDRLNTRWEGSDFRLVLGRQAITWGVAYFWPTLDLFAPFPPERIDREYKSGIDAARLTVPLGGLSELDAVAAVLGTDLSDDGSAGALVRWHLGPVDVGVMAGWFHGDTVGGGFATASLGGTGLRTEAAFTHSGDPGDARLNRESFVRITLGLDRQITSALSVMAEIAWNGFGASHADRYPATRAADRVRRGEVNSLGRFYAGTSVNWQAHPLLLLTGVILVNLDDPSSLVLPQVTWSLSDNLVLVLGGTLGIGPGTRSDGTPASEYGAAPDTLYAGLKVYF